MPSLTLTISYQKNIDQVFSATDLKNLYFTGIKLEDQFGNPIPQETIDFFIQAAQKELQDWLSIKLKRMAYRENRDYMYDDWTKWGYIPTTYPVEKAISLQGFVNTSLQINYSKDYLSAKSQGPDRDLYHRNIHLVPVAGSSSLINNNVLLGIAPYIGYFGNKMVPNYWSSVYVTGYDPIPKDILNAIGKLAAINLLIEVGVLVGGLPGLASKSIGIDGLSQSITTTNNSNKTGFGAKIDAYQAELQRQIPLMKSRYVGITFGVLG